MLTVHDCKDTSKKRLRLGINTNSEFITRQIEVCKQCRDFLDGLVSWESALTEALMGCTANLKTGGSNVRVLKRPKAEVPTRVVARSQDRVGKCRRCGCGSWMLWGWCGKTGEKGGFVCYLCAKEDIVCAFDAQHEGVVLVANLVLPAAKSASRPDVVTSEVGQGISDGRIPLQVRGRVAVF